MSIDFQEKANFICHAGGFAWRSLFTQVDQFALVQLIKGLVSDVGKLWDFVLMMEVSNDNQ
jgi:hypothetical protein